MEEEIINEETMCEKCGEETTTLVGGDEIADLCKECGHITY